MSAIYLPRRWRHQPQGAVEVDPAFAGGIIVTPFQRRWGGASVTSGGGSLRPGPGGVGFSQKWVVGRVPFAQAGATTWICSFSTTGSTLAELAGEVETGSGYLEDLLVNSARETTSTGSLELVIRSDLGGMVKKYTGPIGVNDGRMHTVVWRFVSAASYECWVDGVEHAVLSAPDTMSAPPSPGTTALDIWLNVRNFRGVGTQAAPPEQAIYLYGRLPTLVSSADAKRLSENPWQLFRAPSHRIWFDVGGGAPAAIEGDVVAEESGADALAATGSVVVAGSLAASETGADTFAAAGGAVATGTLAASETGEDTLAGAGAVLVAGQLGAAETGADTAAATGKVLVSGALAVTETGADTLASTGAVPVAGALAAAEIAQDTFSASGAGQAVGTLAAVEVGTDTITAAGKVVVSGAVSTSETGADAAQATGAVLVAGSLSASESGIDTFSSTGEQPAVTGDFAASEIGTDGFAAVGIVPAIGSFDLLEAGHDSLSGAGQIIVAGMLGAVESGQDTFIATPAGSISGVMAAIEAADTFAATGHGRAPRGARRAGDRGYAAQTLERRPQVQTMRRPRQTG